MIMKMELCPFHLTEVSPWPFVFCVNSLMSIMSLIFFFNSFSFSFFFLGFSLMLLSLMQWSRDIIREGSLMGFHTNEVEKSMKWSMSWFISSEVFFFFSFFWGFFTFTSSPVQESGNSWPPFMILTMDPFAVPLLNTLILISSGISLTWGHHSIMKGDYNEGITGFSLTVFLGIYFSCLQMMEYMNSSFSFYDSIYGSIFFLSTGFHGTHVLIGTFLLIICLFRIFKNQHNTNHHIGIETSSWYWHFVDVVWLFLFCCIYWWGG